MSHSLYIDMFRGEKIKQATQTEVKNHSGRNSCSLTTILNKSSNLISRRFLNDGKTIQFADMLFLLRPRGGVGRLLRKRSSQSIRFVRGSFVHHFQCSRPIRLLLLSLCGPFSPAVLSLSSFSARLPPPWPILTSSATILATPMLARSTKRVMCLRK